MEVQTNPIQHSYETQTIPAQSTFSTQTKPLSNTYSTQTIPSQDFTSQTTFEDTNIEPLNESILNSDKQKYPGFYDYNFEFDKLGLPSSAKNHSSVYDINRYSTYIPNHLGATIMNDQLFNYSALDKTFDSAQRDSKVKKKLNLDYNEPTPKRPDSIMDFGITGDLDVSNFDKNSTLKSIDQTIMNQPVTKMNESKIKNVDTPDASKREISTYSPEEKSLDNIKTPNINSTNITERNKPLAWTENSNQKKKKKKKN